MKKKFFVGIVGILMLIGIAMTGCISSKKTYKEESVGLTMNEKVPIGRGEHLELKQAEQRGAVIALYEWKSGVFSGGFFLEDQKYIGLGETEKIGSHIVTLKEIHENFVVVDIS